ncbi:MAG: PD40 domain-containing protein [Muribaculaceae bacterium]|nr:PD40 domain-containing protein [Muribaculaceae bacterium]
MKKLLALMALAAPAAIAATTTPMWLRDVKISPDAHTIAFCYKGDIWTVPTSGGQATRLTSGASYEANPVWSPDGKKIAFASDRNGNMDIYIVDATGGAPVRLTYNSASEIPEAFSPDGSSVLFSAAIQDPAASALFPSARMTELYAVPAAGGATTRVLATPARYISWEPGGLTFLYQDVKGFEDEWRKHHTSGVTRDIWRYDTRTGTHTNITHRRGEDTNPAAGQGKNYFLSERDGGSMNVYALADDGHATAVTHFTTHPVRFLSHGADGTLCFTYDGEIYTMREGAEPAKVAISLIDETLPDVEKLTASRGASEASASPDGEMMAIVYRGDVFVTSVEYETTARVTSTPAAESGVQWSPDGKKLIYASERNGRSNIYTASMARPDIDGNFANATSFSEKALFPDDGHERSCPEYSPDGKKLAFVLDRTKLAVMDVATGAVRELTDGTTHPQRNGRFSFQWSPDSRWIATDIVARRHEPYSDVAIINVADGNIINITNSGYFDETIRWALDGNAILFGSERYGMRNHASWGSQYDVMLAFLNRDAYDRFLLSEEDYALRKELDKKSKKDDKKTESKAKKGKKEEAEESKADNKTINVEPDGIDKRIVRLTPMSTDLIDAIITSDGETLYYTTQADQGANLWKLALRDDDGAMEMVKKISGGAHFDATPDLKNMFLIGSSIRKFEPKGAKITPVAYSAAMRLDHNAERDYMFDYVAREEAERFYTADMHGVDWPAMTEAYRKFMPHISNNYDFAELLSEWLGELNVSHTGGRYSAPASRDADRTASLGLLYDYSFAGPGLKVEEVVVGGPFDKAASKMRPGAVITAINGTPLAHDTDYAALLADIAGRKTLVAFTDASGASIEEVVLPIGAGAFSELLYERWVDARRAEVDSLSGGRLGYVHIQSMGDDSFRRVYSDLLGRYNDREGVVVDIRWNGGGRLHEDIEVLLSGEKYLTQEIRGTATCDMPSRRWNKPSIMLMSEACYSNAHGTPWVYKHKGIGRLVGAPVAGTMTSVNWVRMQDPSMVFGIPVIGYRLADGSVLENQELEPDVTVLNTPEGIAAGRDDQLRTAVEELLKDIDARKK